MECCENTATRHGLSRSGGLNRFYYDCTRYMPQVGVEIRGLVAGSVVFCMILPARLEAFAPKLFPAT